MAATTPDPKTGLAIDAVTGRRAEPPVQGLRRRLPGPGKAGTIRADGRVPRPAASGGEFGPFREQGSAR